LIDNRRMAITAASGDESARQRLARARTGTDDGWGEL